MSPTPVWILSGFLGSGKTTLLLRLMESAVRRGLQAGILMNELGRLDLDGVLLQNEHPGLPIEKLLDGCVCCDRKSELSASLIRLLDKKPDVVFIELTGVANPEEIADCLAEPVLLERYRLQSVITVLDAEFTLEYNSFFSSDRRLIETLRRQMEVADRIIVNKIDLATPSQLDKITKLVRKHNPNAEVTYANYSTIDTDAILSRLVPQGQVPKPSAYTYSAKPRFTITSSSSSSQSTVRSAEQTSVTTVRSYSRLQTVSLPFPPNASVSRKGLEQFLSRLPGRLIRAKGYIPLQGQSLPHLMQYAGKHTEWKPSQHTYTYLVLIGMDMDPASVDASWREYLASNR